MSRRARRILLDAADQADRIRCLSDRVDARSLAEGRNPVVTITRMGSFHDPRYGDFEITRPMLESMVRNFEGGVYGQRVALDVAHRPNDGAAGYFRRLFLEGNKLRGEVELTDLGRDAIERRGMIYVSAEFIEDYVDNETRQQHGPTLLGAGLVVRPAIKRLDPIELSEDSLGEPRLCVTERVSRFLFEEIEPMWKELLKRLREQLKSMKLSDAHADALVSACETAGKALGDDKAAAEKLVAEFEATGKKLAEAQPGDQPIQLSVNAPQQDDATIQQAVTKALAEAEKARADEAKQLAEQRDALVKVFTDALGELKGLSEEQQKPFRDAAELIAPGMTEDQVRKLAEHQKAQAEQLAASRQLADLGYGSPTGDVRISTDERNTALQLQEQLLTGLRNTYVASSGRLQLQEKASPFVERVLTEFDRINAHRIHREHKMLAGGEVGVADSQLPVGFQRTVIREALSDLRVLELVQTLTDFQATSTTEIPYEERDISEVSADGVVFERGAIPRAGIAQKMDTAYVLPMKLAYLLTNEVIHFSRASQINWDAWARNVESNARVIRELLCRRIINMLVREADSYMAVTVSDESIAAQLDGSTSTIKTAEFPIVRPFQQYNLRGETVGSARNPITISIDGTPVVAWDGSGEQSAGTYYRIASCNLGYIQLVDEAGDPVTPNEATATISYDRVANVRKFDLDVPSEMAREKHLNGLVQAIGRQKAVLDQDRYSMPDYLLMAATVHNDITDAEQFAREAKRDGTDTNAQGDLERVKGLSAWSTNAPGNDMAEERILMGQRGGLSYVVAKPWAVGEPFEHINSDGRPTGQKQAYGEEYSALKVPEPLRARMTSILVYSAGDR